MYLFDDDTCHKAMEMFLSNSGETIEVKNDNGAIIGLLTVPDLLHAIMQGEDQLKIKEVIDSSMENPSSPSKIGNNEYISMVESPFFTKLIDSLYDGVYITDGSGVTVKVNKAYERITGLKREQLIGHHMNDVVTSGLINKSVSLKVIKERRPVTIMQTIKQERKIIVSGMPVFNDENDILFYWDFFGKSRIT